MSDDDLLANFPSDDVPSGLNIQYLNFEDTCRVHCRMFPRLAIDVIIAKSLNLFYTLGDIFQSSDQDCTMDFLQDSLLEIDGTIVRTLLGLAYL